jgi:hypothetical protein
MNKPIRNIVLTLALSAASLTLTTSAFAEEWPLAGGDYWDVAGIDVKDGGDLKYASWLATEWKKNAEFAKSKGWIKDYMIFANAYPRHGEPDLYLVRVTESIVSGPEGEKRSKEYQEWSKKTMEQMDAESGNRAEFREVLSSSLLQELLFRD